MGDNLVCGQTSSYEPRGVPDAVICAIGRVGQGFSSCGERCKVRSGGTILQYSKEQVSGRSTREKANPDMGAQAGDSDPRGLEFGCIVTSDLGHFARVTDAIETDLDLFGLKPHAG